MRKENEILIDGIKYVKIKDLKDGSEIELLINVSQTSSKEIKKLQTLLDGYFSNI